MADHNQTSNTKSKTLSSSLASPKPGLAGNCRLSRRTVISGLVELTLMIGGVTWFASCDRSPSSPNPSTTPQISLTPKVLYIYHGHSGGITSLAWSPDGKRIASGSADKTVQVWEV